MKLRKLTAGVAAVALSFAAVSAPQATAFERSSLPSIGNAPEQNEAQEPVSFESSDGAYITPNETIHLTADHIGEDVNIINAYIETAPNQTSALWDVKRSVNDDGALVLSITAPAEPDDQFGTTQNYGEYPVNVRYNLPGESSTSYYFNINFAEEKPEEEPAAPENPFDLTSKIDFEELLKQFPGSSK